MPAAAQTHMRESPALPKVGDLAPSPPMGLMHTRRGQPTPVLSLVAGGSARAREMIGPQGIARRVTTKAGNLHACHSLFFALVWIISIKCIYSHFFLQHHGHPSTLPQTRRINKQLMFLKLQCVQLLTRKELRMKGAGESTLGLVYTTRQIHWRKTSNRSFPSSRR